MDSTPNSVYVSRLAQNTDMAFGPTPEAAISRLTARNLIAFGMGLVHPDHDIDTYELVITDGLTATSRRAR